MLFLFLALLVTSSKVSLLSTKTKFNLGRLILRNLELNLMVESLIAESSQSEEKVEDCSQEELTCNYNSQSETEIEDYDAELSQVELESQDMSSGCCEIVCVVLTLNLICFAGFYFILLPGLSASVELSCTNNLDLENHFEKNLTGKSIHMICTISFLPNISIRGLHNALITHLNHSFSYFVEPVESTSQSHLRLQSLFFEGN